MTMSIETAQTIERPPLAVDRRVGCADRAPLHVVGPEEFE